MPAPDSGFVEVEFTAGVWTPVTAWVEWGQGLSSKFGRQSVYSDPAAATMSVTLNNSDGRFTPLRQTLKDLTTPHPYWPNLVPRKRIRWGYTVGAARFVQFTGYVSGWPAGFDGVLERVSVSATDRQRILAGVVMQSPLLSTFFGQQYYWPLDEASGAVAALGFPTPPTSNDAPNEPPLRLVGADVAGAATFGFDGVGSGNGSSVLFAPSAVNAGQVLRTDSLRCGSSGRLTVEFWLRIPAGTLAWPGVGFGNVVDLVDDRGINELLFAVTSSGAVQFTLFRGDGSASTAVSAVSVADDRWHYCVGNFSPDGNNVQLIVDDGAVADGSTTYGPGNPNWQTLVVGDSTDAATGGGPRFRGAVGHVAIKFNPGTQTGSVQSATERTARYLAGRGWPPGDTAGQRIIRFLQFAGLNYADYTVDASSVVVGSYPQAGQDVITGCRAMATSEGGGSVVFVDQNGSVRFVDRDYRRSQAPAVTLDANTDLDRGGWSPSFDDSSLVNYCTGTRATASGQASTQVAMDNTSIAAFQQAAGADFTSYARDDGDVLRVAQARVAGNSQPAFRVAAVTVDLWTAESPDLYTLLGRLVIGQRVRIVNVPAAAAPNRVLDLIVEGWSLTVTDSSFLLGLDTSPADNPPEGVWDDAAYGRWQTDGQTLTAGITATTTSLKITSPGGGVTFSQDAADYPLTVVVGAEHIQLTTRPSGSVSPQTFSPVVRGVDGTVAAAQPTGSAIDLYPAATWAL